jgi:hypothetical protein
VTTLDVSSTTPIPYVSLADASVQDHSTGDKQFPGLHNDCSWIWAMVDTEDGKRYEMIRCISASGTFDFTLHECSTDLWATPKNVRFPGEQDLYWGPILWLGHGGEQVLFPANVLMGQRHPITLTLGPEKYVWKDDDVIDMVMTPLPGNVTRIYVPGLPDDVGYTSTGCTLSGSINGSAITGGYGGIDRMYCLPGMSCQVSKIAELEHYWFVWAALMEDGTYETGNAMLGSGDYATATFRRPGETPVIATNTEVGSKVVWEERNGVNQPVRATLEYGGKAFDFEATHNAANAGVALGIAWMHGEVQERGGKKPVKSWATMEVIKIRATPRD